MTYWYFKNNELQYTSNDMYITLEAGYVVAESKEEADTTKIYKLVDGKITIIGETQPPPVD